MPNYRTWIWINFKIGALSFGSVSRVVLYQEEVVEMRNWLSEDQFREALTLAQILPGPNLVNLAAAIGYKLFSLPKAVIALLPLLVPGALLAVLIALFVPLDRPWVAELFHGFAIGALFLMGRFLWMLFQGISAQSPVQKIQGGNLKLYGRYVLSAIGMVILLQGTPIIPVVLIGTAVCLAWEFTL
ncbi:MAG: chromate transporter [Bdellovibrionia bacterium]